MVFQVTGSHWQRVELRSTDGRGRPSPHEHFQTESEGGVPSSLKRVSNCILCVVLAACSFAVACNGQAIAPVITVDHGPNAPQQLSKPYVILVSLDGFRYDYAKKYRAEHLLTLAAQGAGALEGMLPAYPSITFPNHYTIVTGLYPEHHGIVANNFYDPARKEAYSYHDAKAVGDGTWYGGTPLWVLAEQQGMRSASFFWVGSEADIQGVRPSYYLRCGLSRDGFYRKCGAYIGTRIDNEACVWRPHRIERVLLDERNWGATVNRNTKQMGDAVIFRRGGDRLTIGRPCWRTLQVERIGHNPRFRAVGLRHVQERPPVLPDRECDVLAIGGDGGAAKNLRCLANPQLGSSSIRQLPDTLRPALRRHIEKKTWTQSRGEHRAGRQRDGRRFLGRAGRVINPQPPQCSLRFRERHYQAATVGTGRERRVPVKARTQAMGSAPLDIDAVRPRPGTVGIAGQV